VENLEKSGKWRKRRCVGEGVGRGFQGVLDGFLKFVDFLAERRS
jgi:hypothetical protein